MPAQGPSGNIARLQEAQLINPETLTADDIALIDQFTPAEIGMMIQIAAKAYGSDVEIIKLLDTKSGRLRIMFPL